MGDINALPQDLIEKIVSRTSPKDACGSLSIVSKSFQSAAISDNVWSTFLPAELISRRVLHLPPKPRFDDPWNNIEPNTLQAFPTYKDLYLFLSENPLIIDDGNLCFWLDKSSGLRCFHIFPKSLYISEPEDQLEELYYIGRGVSEAPELWCAENLEIYGNISTSLLSPNTSYKAYLLFYYSNSYFDGLEEDLPLETYVGIDGGGESESKIVYIPYMPMMYETVEGPNGFEYADLPVLTGSQYPKQRKNNWFEYEIELGDYFNSGGGDNGELKMRLLDVSGERRSGIAIFGIEIRPNGCKII